MTLKTLIESMAETVLFATPVALVLLLFFWNMSQLIFHASNPEKLKQAQARIFWSVIALFVLFSLGGILAVFQNTLFGSSGVNQQFSAPSGSSNTFSGSQSGSNSNTSPSVPRAPAPTQPVLPEPTHSPYTTPI